MNTPYKVFVTDYAWPALNEELAILEPVGASLEYVSNYARETLLECAATADAIMTCWHPVPEEALRAASRCKVVNRYGIGLDNIPVALATELGMLVTNVPDFCLDELTDQVMAYILAFARQLPALDANVKAGRWKRETDFPIHRLRGQTLGLVGFGNTARRLAPKAAALGLEILAFTPRLQEAQLLPGVARAASLHDLLRQSDYVSIHAPLHPETERLFNAQAFKAMKKSAVLINTARGAIVDEDALQAALAAGDIAGVALDVRVAEPPSQPAPWQAHPHVLMTPHSAFYSEEALQELARKGAQNVADALCNRIPKYLVNPAVLERDNCRLDRSACG